MEVFTRILKAAVEAHASDIHIKQGGPVIFRLARQLVAIESPLPTAEWLENVVSHIVPPHMKAQFADKREADFSYWIHGIGRFRTNVFQQRGELAIAMRYVKAQVPDFEALGLPDVLKSIAEAPRGIVLLAGTPEHQRRRE